MKLTLKDLIILGMTNFALYVGAGNIIFPPFIGLKSGFDVPIAAFGFLITGVGLPVIAAIALAKVSGALNAITAPIGAKAGLIITVICYLSIGPLFAIPRTTTVAYELAINPFVNSQEFLLGYSVIYFAIVIVFALYPAKILDTVGKILSPIKVTALFILCVTALFLSAGDPVEAVEPFKSAPFSQGIVQGYLTLDTLASLAFGIVIVEMIRSRGVTDTPLTVKYATISGTMAGCGLTFIYVCLFKLGNGAYPLAPEATNGAEILSAYVHFAFGEGGDIFLAVLIIVACMVTAIGLTCACSSYFSRITKIPYKVYVLLIAIFSTLVANMGLTQLIQFSVPILTAIYPLFIVLVFASFISDHFKSAKFVVAPTAFLALIFGINDGTAMSGFPIFPKVLQDNLPLYSSNLSWLIPCLILFIVLAIIDKVKKNSK